MNDKIAKAINAIVSIIGYSMLTVYGGWQVAIAVFLIEMTILITIAQTLEGDR